MIAAHRSLFGRLAKKTSHMVGHPATFFISVTVVVLWAASGPIFHWSDTWQLVINTATTVITFLIVFLIQNTQNRDAAAVQIKLDEIIRSIHGAHNALLNLEELEEQDIARLRANYRKLAELAREELRLGKVDTESPDVDVR